MRCEKTMAFTLPSENKSSSMDEIAVVLRRFGDEQSTLLDQFERLSFEVQLNQAILRRSSSEPSVGRSKLQAPLPPLVTPKAPQVQKARTRGSGFSKVLKKVLKSLLIRKGKNLNSYGGRKEVPDPRNPKYMKAFSRSLRF